jgi:hypothetical protein
LYRRQSRDPAPFAAARQVATPTIFAEGRVNLALTPQFDHQTERLLYCLFVAQPEAFWA